MTGKTTKRNTPAAQHTAIQPHDLLLAGIGAVSLGRKQILQAYANGYEGVAELRQRAQETVHDAVKTVSDTVQSLQKQARTQVTPLQKKVKKLASDARTEAEARLAPVLEKLGVKAPAKRPAAKKRTAARRPAKRGRKAA